MMLLDFPCKPALSKTVIFAYEFVYTSYAYFCLTFCLWTVSFMAKLFVQNKNGLLYEAAVEATWCLEPFRRIIDKGRVFIYIIYTSGKVVFADIYAISVWDACFCWCSCVEMPNHLPCRFNQVSLVALLLYYLFISQSSTEAGYMCCSKWFLTVLFHIFKRTAAWESRLFT
jgi:hypothetical protein